MLHKNIGLTPYSLLPACVQALYIAYGSLNELETQVLLSVDLGFMQGKMPGLLAAQLGDTERLLKKLIHTFEKKCLP